MNERACVGRSCVWWGNEMKQLIAVNLPFAVGREVFGRIKFHARVSFSEDAVQSPLFSTQAVGGQQ